jgi:catechol 2,3-dioxygenase-like lactoylglutathione lyase family enzyme
MTDISQKQGAFSWCELMTTDTAAAKDFYSQLFGWAIVDRPMPDDLDIAISCGVVETFTNHKILDNSRTPDRYSGV